MSTYTAQTVPTRFVEANRFLGLAERGIAPAGCADHFIHETGVDFAGLAKMFAEAAEIVTRDDLQHGSCPSSAQTAGSAGHLAELVKTPFENEMRRRVEI